MELSHDELLQARTEVTHHALSYVKSTALGCAIKLGVADAIHRATGGRLSLDALHAALALAPARLPYLRRLMRALAASGVFAQDDDGNYRLTPASSLLLTSDDRSLVPLILLQLSPFSVAPVMGMAEWFQSGGGDETAFRMTHGADVWDVCRRDAAVGGLFNDAMTSDSQFTMDMVIQAAGQVFDGVTSLVDVAGSTGAAAKALAAAFPHIKYTVLDLPQVIDSIPADDEVVVEFVAGDMMEFIPRADALLLKFVFHDWSDKDCLNILKRCKEAIPSREAGGKLIIIDMVVGSSSQAMSNETQLLLDLYISTMTTGMEREEKEWAKLFKEAGFTEYKIRPVLGLRSIIEVFP